MRFALPMTLFLLWPVQPPVGAQAGTVIVEAPPALAGAARQIDNFNPARLEQALDRAGLAMPERVRVQLLTNDDIRTQNAAPWVVGQAAGLSNIVIFPERISTYPYDSLETVFRHEIVHLALNSAAGRGDLPRWFHEGVAVSIESDWGAADNLRLLLAAAGGPEVHEVARLFESANRPETTEAYLLAAALVDDLRSRYGPNLPGAIAADVAKGVPFDLAFQRHTGETPDEAATIAWATYRRITTWLPTITSANAIWTLILALAFLAFAVRVRQRALRRREPDDDEEPGRNPKDPKDPKHLKDLKEPNRMPR